jgi:small redox-active disulfide protein 2
MINIKIVGSGCANCQKLAALCQEVIKEAGTEATLEKVTDMNLFPQLGIFLTPGLIINDEVKSSGKIPTKSTLARWIQQAEHQALRR